MRRIIEDFIEKRKQRQHKLKDTLMRISCAVMDSGLFFTGKKKKAVSELFLEFNTDLNELITIQDREWDAYASNHSTMVFKSLEWKIGKLEAEYSNVKTLLGNFIELERSLEKVITSLEDRTDPEALQRLRDIREKLSPCQYSEFEHRFRGDTRQVREKTARYLPLYQKSDDILDIGCGRGEFLELLTESGKKARGIDLSPSMLRIAAEKNLNVQKADALHFLQSLPDESLGGVFSAQVIEHLSPDYLRHMLLEIHRTLRKGAPLTLETVNPLSLFALSNIYFLDITHEKPLHPEYMRYLLESSGFANVSVIYPEELTQEQLQEIGPENAIAREFNTNVDKLNKILYSSPVYAVTGIKS